MYSSINLNTQEGCYEEFNLRMIVNFLKHGFFSRA